MTEMNRFPHEYLELPLRERALVDAVILNLADERKKEVEKIERGAKAYGR